MSYYRLKSHSTKSRFESAEPELLIFDESCIDDEYFENSRNCVRVNKVRSAYLNDFIHDEKLESLYVKWRDTREDIWLDGYDALGNFVKPCFVKASKRGNDVYKHLVSEKFKIIDSMPPIYFFDDDHSIKRTPMIFVTFTVDTKKYSKNEAWNVITSELNRFETLLRQQVTTWLKQLKINAKGTFVKLYAVESHESGYPHIHATYFFHNWEFVVFQHLKKKNDEFKIEYRIPDKFADQIQRLWRMGSDDPKLKDVSVKIKGVQDTLGAFSEIKKYVTKEIFTPKGVKTCAMLWVHRKKSYSLSRCNPFKQALPEHIAKEQDLFKHDALTRSYLSDNLDKWRNKDFIGSIWGKDAYLSYYTAVMNKKLRCGDLAEPNATDLVNATMQDYNIKESEIAYFKFRGAILHSDLLKFLEKVPDDWAFLVDPPPGVLAEMRFYFGIDSPGYDSVSDKDYFVKED
jgi:hypothetical protein